jgi:hypothetical protein
VNNNCICERCNNNNSYHAGSSLYCYPCIREVLSRIIPDMKEGDFKPVSVCQICGKSPVNEIECCLRCL